MSIKETDADVSNVTEKVQDLKLQDTLVPVVVDYVIEDGVACPFCKTIWTKDNACSYVVCGLIGAMFHKGAGFCGRAFCFDCGKKYCNPQYNSETGARLSTYRDNHDNICCRQEEGFREEDYCCGGHSPHCAKRW